MASAGPSEARTLGGGVAALLPRLRTQHRAVSGAASVVLIVTGAFLATTPAFAATPAPGYTIHSLAIPTDFSAADTPGCLSTLSGQFPNCDAYQVTVTDAGSKETDGSTLTLADTVPAGLTVQRISLFWAGAGATAASLNGTDLGFLCDTTSVQCPFPIALQPDDTLEMTVFVSVDDSTPHTVANAATVFGGGAPGASTSAQNTVGSSAPGFGPAALGNYIAGPDGAPDTQAGDHPYEFTSRIDLNTVFRIGPDQRFAPNSVEDPRDISVDLPLGFLGSAQAAPTCSFAQLSSHISGGVGGCPSDTIVGHILTEPVNGDSVSGPIYNMVPEHGVAAEFGFVDILAGAHALYARVVPGPNGYVLRTTGPDLPQIPLTDVVVTLFGNPAARDESGNTPVPFFTNPSACDGQPLTSAVHIDSWQHPGALNPDGTPDLADPNWASTTSDSPAVTGCNKLQFQPTLSVQPDSTSADSASGLDVEIKVPQSTDPDTLATPPLKKGVVTLPQGITVNPSAADGLASCSPAQIDLPSAAEPSCPDSSKVGTVQLQTPLLPGTLTGSIYLATQNDNPFNSLLAGYIVIDDPTTGVVIKIPGKLTPDPVTGQITGVFDNNPQFPFSDLELHFFGGPRGDLTTPPSCGTYQTTSELTPWSAPDSGPPATPSDMAAITSGPGGGTCPDPSHLSPSFSAGTVSPLAGSYSPFVFKLARENGSARIAAIDTTLPQGLLGKLAGIPYCSGTAIDAAATKRGSTEKAAPSCPLDSEVGTVNVGAGSGAPFYVQGHAYLAGPYKAAPLSLAIVTPAVAGPFDLGTVVVRTALYVNETTAQIHAVSDPIPTILQGIPLDIRSIVLNMNRPNFTLNPTSCEPTAVLGTATSSLGGVASLSDRFQVGGCNGLGFKPSLKLSLKGSTKRAGVPALKAVLTYPKGAYANVKSISTVLPKSEFIDNAHIGNTCTRVQFNEGAGHGSRCPSRSVLGHATAFSPLLDKPLEGTVYLRSNGGERELPDIVAALHGQIDVTLVGFIDSVGKKHSEVSRIRTRFMNVPDAPVSRFVLQLAGAKKGLLQNSANLCKAKNIAQVKAIAQNGKTYNTEPKVINDCRRKGKKK
jgi:hypothetical protein